MRHGETLREPVPMPFDTERERHGKDQRSEPEKGSAVKEFEEFLEWYGLLGGCIALSVASFQAVLMLM